MKIKKSNLKYIYDTLFDVDGFLRVSLGYLDEDQIDFIEELISKIDKSLELLNEIKNK